MSRRPAATLVLACIAVFVVILDATIVAVALADIRADLGLGADQLAWVVNAYTLVFAGFLLLGGRCADVFGLRAAMLAGAVVFTVGSLGAGLADQPPVLLAARAVQGLGGALLMPSTLAALTTAYPPGAARTRALAAWSTVGAFGGAAGTVLGGVLTEWAGWRWVFLVNLPICVVVLVLTVLVLPGRSDGPRSRLDVVGAVLATGGLTAVVYAVMTVGEAGWSDPVVLGSLVGGLVVLGLFGLHQQYLAREPLMPPSILRVRAVAGANAVMFLIGLGFFASPVLLSVYLQTVYGQSPFEAGLAFVPGAIGLIVSGRLAGRITVAIGPRRAAVLGLVVAAVGFGGLGAVLADGSSSLVLVEAGVVLFGLGVGTAFTPITVVATSALPAQRQGLGAGLLNTVRQASGALGLAILSVVSTSGQAPAGGTGYGTAYGLAGVFALAAALLAVVVLPREARRPAAPDTAPPAVPELRGRVCRADGTVPARAVLTLTDPSGRQVDRFHSEDGRYSLHSPRGGRHLLICSSPSDAPCVQHVVVAGIGVDHDIVLDRRQPDDAQRPPLAR